MKSSRKADHGQVHQLSGDVISSDALLATTTALAVDSGRGGVDRGDRTDVGGVSDGQSDFSSSV